MSSRSAIIMAHDLTVAGLSFILAFYLRNGFELHPSNLDAVAYGGPLFVAVAGVFFYLHKLHRRVWGYVSVVDLVAIARAAAWAVVAMLAIVFLVDRLDGVPRSVPLIQWFVLVVMLCTSRLAYRALKPRLLRARTPAPDRPPEAPVLLYGCGPLASLFVHAVQATPGANLRVVGIVDDGGDHHGRYIGDVPVVGHVRELERVLGRLAVHGVQPRRLVVACAAADLPDGAAAALAAARSAHGLQVDHLPDLLGLRDDVAAAVWGARCGGEARMYFRLRRLVDAAVSAAALLFLLPLVAAVTLLVLLDGGGPVLFRQVRPGRRMRPFTLYKFRTMRGPYDAAGRWLDDAERTSALGRFLRRTRLDELPQLYNVLWGDMSFIGPRPLLPRDLPPERFEERAAVRPGITGWAQVNGGHQLTVADKMALDLWYVRHAGPLTDARIVWLTLRMMLLGERVNRAEIERARMVVVA